MVVQVSGVWQLYCGSFGTFDRLSSFICSDLGFSTTETQIVPLAKLEERGIHLAESDSNIDASSECEGAGFVRCKQ